MLSWLGSIGDAFGIIMQVVTSFFSGILAVFSLVAEGMVYIVAILGFLPSVVLGFAMAGLTICVVFHLIGR